MVNIAAPPPASGVLSHGLAAGSRAPELDVPVAPDGRRALLANYRGSPLGADLLSGRFHAGVHGRARACSTSSCRICEALGAKVVGISCDSLWSHGAYAKELNLRMPLLSDFHPKGALSRRYEVYRDDIGTSERALFVIDSDGFIFWSEVSPIEINPGADGVLDALERLTGREVAFASVPPQPPHAQPEERR